MGFSGGLSGRIGLTAPAWREGAYFNLIEYAII